MYRLTIFVLISCVTSQRLVGAVRRGGSRSGRGNLYFDSYDRPYLEEFDESEDGLREAVLMHPEEVLDIPPIPMARDYEAADPVGIGDIWEGCPPLDIRNPQMSRGLIHDLLQQIQAAFAKWPPWMPSKPSTSPRFFYQLDSSLVETQQALLRVLLATVSEKTCKIIEENQDSPGIIFMGTPGCSIEAVENKIIIGYECFEPTMILKLIFKLFGFCQPTPLFKASGLYLHNFRNKLTRDPEEDTGCTDKHILCTYLTYGNRSYPCSLISAVKAMCPRTCRLCGDTCVDYDPDCNTDDTLKDCLSNWGHMKSNCANTCGLCKNSREFEPCFDYFGCCVYYARQGFCPRYPELMKEYCPLSCGYCKPKACVDERDDCPELERLGGCTKMANLMERSCRRTCNMCMNEVENRDDDEMDPPENCSPDDDFVKKYCSWDPIIV